MYCVLYRNCLCLCFLYKRTIESKCVSLLCFIDFVSCVGLISICVGSFVLSYYSNFFFPFSKSILYFIIIGLLVLWFSLSFSLLWLVSSWKLSELSSLFEGLLLLPFGLCSSVYLFSLVTLLLFGFHSLIFLLSLPLDGIDCSRVSFSVLIHLMIFDF